MELGLYHFADSAPGAGAGGGWDAGANAKRLGELLDMAQLAEEVGLDVFALGEHHRPDYIASNPATILAAIAARTKRIRLSSAVTILSSDDPVRVFQQFATLDLLSQGRAEIMAGRGSFIESFPLFGYDLKDYDALFAEKLDLLLALRDEEHVRWQGNFRSPITGQGVYPRPLQSPLPIWLAVGGTPQSVVRAATLGLPLAIAIIGGRPEQFAPLVDLYKRAWQAAGHDAKAMRVSINAHGFIGDGGNVLDQVFPFYQAMFDKIGRERGWPPVRRSDYDAQCELRGAQLIGDPQAIIDKILFQHEKLGQDRFLLYPGYGAMPHADVMRAVELFGSVVAPAIRKALAASRS